MAKKSPVREITDDGLDRLLNACGVLTMYSQQRSGWDAARDLALEQAAVYYRRRKDDLADAFRNFADICDQKAKVAARQADEAGMTENKVRREVLPWEFGQ